MILTLSIPEWGDTPIHMVAVEGQTIVLYLDGRRNAEGAAAHLIEGHTATISKEEHRERTI